MSKISKGRKQRTHSTLNNIDYADVTKNGQTKRYEGNIIEGMKFSKFQELVGNEISPGKFTYSIYFKDATPAYIGTSKAVRTSLVPIKDNSDDVKSVMQMFKSLEQKVNSKSESVSVDILLSVTKQSYETQITFLNSAIVKSESTIQKLESTIKLKDDELDSCYDQIESLENKSGWNALLDKADQFLPLLKAKLTGSGKSLNLQESNTGDIPGEVLEIIGLIDFVKLQSKPDDYQNLLAQLKKWISIGILPLKGN